MRAFPKVFTSNHFLDLARSPDSGYLLMPAFGPMVLVAASMPAFGKEHRDLMRACFQVQLVFHQC